MTGPTTDGVVVTGSSRPAAAMAPSVIRTVVPYIVGAIITGLLKLGIDIPQGLVTQVVDVAVAGLYYAAVRYLETKGNARWGWLLGLAKAPAYSNLPAPSPDAPDEVLTTTVEGQDQPDQPDEQDDELEPDTVTAEAHRRVAQRAVAQEQERQIAEDAVHDTPDPLDKPRTKRAASDKARKPTKGTP